MKIRNALKRMRELKHWPAKPPKDQPDPTKWSQDVRWGVILTVVSAGGAVGAGVPGSSAGWRDSAVAGSGGVYGDRVRVDQRVCVVPNELGRQRLIDWSRVIVDAATARAKGEITDWTESGGPRQARLEDPCAVRNCRAAIVVGVSAANTNDSFALKPLVKAIPAIRSRRGPRRRKPDKLHADKAYDHTEL